MPELEHDSIELVADEIRVCTLCELARSRTNAVPGAGPSKARIMFIGEGPGWQEDKEGLPFVGASGKFLTELITSAGVDRKDVFITNIVKCRPPGNRDPLPDEMGACAPYLDRQIALINPDVVVTLGRFSMSRWFPGERISRIHGQAKKDGHRMIVPMYHPAAALHQGALRATIEEDFARLPKLLADVERARARLDSESKAPEPPSAQMKMF